MNNDFEKLSIEANENDYNYNFDEVYQEQNKGLKMLLNALGGVLLTYTIIDSILKINSKEKGKISNYIFKIISNSFKSQTEIEKNKMYEVLKNNISNNYYKKVYILSLGTNVNIKKLDDSIIQGIINNVVEGKNWKDRVGVNKKELELLLKKDIKKFLDGNISVNEIKDKIKKRFNTNAYVTKRLVEQEIARCQGEVNEYFANEYNIPTQMFLATLDNKTTDTCRMYDGRVFDRDDPNKPIPPLHIWCRSCLINIPSREWKPKNRMDNITKKNSVWINYSKWYEENIGGV